MIHEPFAPSDACFTFKTHSFGCFRRLMLRNTKSDDSSAVCSFLRLLHLKDTLLLRLLEQSAATPCQVR
jgi:hypothetical protein